MNLRKIIREVIKEQRKSSNKESSNPRIRWKLHESIWSCIEQYASGHFEELADYEYSNEELIKQARDFIRDKDEYDSFVECCERKKSVIVKKEIREALKEQTDQQTNENKMKKIADVIKSGNHRKAAKMIVDAFGYDKALDQFDTYFIMPWENEKNISQQYSILKSDLKKVEDEIFSLKDKNVASSPDKDIFDFISKMLTHEVYEEHIKTIKYQVFMKNGKVNKVWVQDPEVETSIFEDDLVGKITFEKLLDFFQKYGAKKINRQKKLPRMTPYYD